MMQHYLEILKRGGKPAAPERPREEGLAALVAGDVARAEALLPRALAQHPEDPEVLMGLATLADRSGRPEEALGWLQRAHRRNARDLGLLLALGSAYEAVGEPAQALASYRQALTVDARCARAHRGIGALLRDEEPHEAIKALNQAVYHDRTNLEARLMLAELCLQLGDAIRAVTQLHLVLRLAPGRAEVHRLLALAAERLGDRRQMVTELELAVALAPGTAEDYWKLAQGHLALGRDHEALAALAQAARLEDTPGKLHVAWASLAEACGLISVALDAWRVLSGVMAHQGEAHHQLERLLGLPPGPQAQAA
ncbi:MAG: tetratricopeptide repeat protein [Candidatus Sericytochromatia bacterium]|nr:tetratricopeptide repeat protein [Candidatus Sericytochromatia bacterium]